MDFGLQGKRALVTGGSRGIGKAVARALAREGCQVAICARGREALEAAAASIEAEVGGARILPLVIDNYFLLTLSLANTPVLANSLAFLDGSGTSTAALTLSSNLSASLAGLTIHHAYSVTDAFGTGLTTFVSNPFPLTFLP